MRLFVAAGAVLIAGMCATSVRAASFDCAKAATPVEKTICTDKDLSAEDEAMAKAYQAAMVQLSPEGRAALRDSQRQFLTYASVECSDAAPKDMPDDKTHAGCLTRRFRDRTDALRHAVVTAGGLRFLYLTHYRARLATDAGDPAAASLVEEVATSVRIDAPRTDAERTWNRDAEKRAVAALAAAHESSDGDGTFETDDMHDASAGVVVVSASRDLIVSVAVGSMYGHGMGHAEEMQNEARIWSLRLGRTLSASDILDDRTHWRDKLLSEAQEHLKAFDPGQPLNDLAMDFDDTRRWQLKADGLHIVYPAYELGSYLSQAETLLDWKTLKPYLRQDLPFRPQDLQSAVEGVVY
jgi:uncharacterized protein YecT (DUF1311 family)